jgi:hypothetical protein
MKSPVEDEVEAAMAFAESVASSYADHGGSVTDLFASFVGVVVSENKSLGLRCLEAADRWVSRSSSSGSGVVSSSV